MTVGALCAHLVRAAGSVLAYLDRTDPDARPTGELLTPVTYFHAAIDSPIHERIKEVSADEAPAGPARSRRRCARGGGGDADPLGRGTEPTGCVAALGGRMLTLDDFCRTRLIEVLVHLDDLAASVGLPVPGHEREGRAIVIDILIGIAADAARRLGGAARAGPRRTPSGRRVPGLLAVGWSIVTISAAGSSRKPVRTQPRLPPVDGRGSGARRPMPRSSRAAR